MLVPALSLLPLPNIDRVLALDYQRLRVVFRLMFVLPLLVLACDGLQENGPHVINKTA